MTIETIQVTDRVAYPLTKKVNPIWWFQGPDGWTVPETNNGTPYLPDVTNVWLRRFYWFVLRNPMMNFVGFVLGVEDRNYSATGSAPVMRTTGRDCDPVQLGWRWAVLILYPSLPACGATIMMVLGALWISAWLWMPAVVYVAYIAGPLPFISYYGPLCRSERLVEFYFGWRPASGGFGLKFVLPSVTPSSS